MSRRFLLTNDDGIEAPGLAALERSIEGLGAVQVVAPAEEQSGVGHRVTTREPIRVNVDAPERWRVHGTPGDCSRLALKGLGLKPDWVLAGINRGGNLGMDAYMSGTLAAAREATLLGCHAIAISQYVSPEGRLDWSLTASRARRVIELLFERPRSRDFFWSINLPAISSAANAEPEIVFCELDVNPHDFRFEERDGHWVYEGNYHGRPRTPGRDIDVCFSGRIAVTAVAIETVTRAP